MAKIIGGTTSTPMRVPDWNQTDPNRADYIKNKPKGCELIASGTLTEDVQKFTISLDNDGNEFTLRDFFYIELITTVAEKAATVRVWVNDATQYNYLTYSPNTLSTTAERHSRFLYFYCGESWQDIALNTLKGQAVGNIAGAMLNGKNENNVTKITIGCMSAGETLPAGTQYTICGRRV